MSIDIINVSHTYAIKTPFEKTALYDINLTIHKGEYVAIAGHTGCGKSTLIQIIAGLIVPTTGDVFIDKINLKSNKKLEARRQIGIVFQYPETQLFEETVEKDIAFGPKNLNLGEAEINERVQESMKLVNLSYKELKDVSPFSLSGGQKRRVAIAGVLAMCPQFLILDEPTAGLDPRAHVDLMQQIKSLHSSNETTIILISHNMEDIAQFAQRVIVMSQGKILADNSPGQLFSQTDILNAAGLNVPSVTNLLFTLKKSGLNIDTNAITVDTAEKIIVDLLLR